MTKAFVAVWDIVKVPFPYADRPVQQFRPAVVVGQHRSAGSPHLIWVLMVTSAVNRGWSGDVTVSDLGLAGLPVESVVRCAKIATVEAIAAARLGTLGEGDRTAIRREMGAALVDLLGPLISSLSPLPAPPPARPAPGGG